MIDVEVLEKCRAFQSVICTTRAQKSCPCIQSLSLRRAGGTTEPNWTWKPGGPAQLLLWVVASVWCPSGMEWGLVQVPKSGGKVGDLINRQEAQPVWYSVGRAHLSILIQYSPKFFIREYWLLRHSIIKIQFQSFYLHSTISQDCSVSIYSVALAKYGTRSAKKMRYILTSATFLLVY